MRPEQLDLQTAFANWSSQNCLGFDLLQWPVIAADTKMIFVEVQKSQSTRHGISELEASKNGSLKFAFESVGYAFVCIKLP